MTSGYERWIYGISVWLRVHGKSNSQFGHCSHRCAGPLAWADPGLLLVEKLVGQAVMLETARFLLVDPPRRSQSQYKAFLPRFDHGNKEVLQVQHQFMRHRSFKSR